MQPSRRGVSSRCDKPHKRQAVVAVATKCGNDIVTRSSVLTGPVRPMTSHVTGRRTRYSARVYAIATPIAPHGKPATNDATVTIEQVNPTLKNSLLRPWLTYSH